MQVVQPEQSFSTVAHKALEVLNALPDCSPVVLEIGSPLGCTFFPRCDHEIILILISLLRFIKPILTPFSMATNNLLNQLWPCWGQTKPPDTLCVSPTVRHQARNVSYAGVQSSCMWHDESARKTSKDTSSTSSLLVYLKTQQVFIETCNQAPGFLRNMRVQDTANWEQDSQ